MMLPTLLRKTRLFFSLVRFSHTVFALPFALSGLLVAAKDWPTPPLLFLVLLAMVTARNYAMAVNRYLDARMDAKNPRTAAREIPAGLLSKKAVLFFIVINALAFIATTYFLNPLCFRFSFAVLALLAFYSWSKRFTALCHLLLGLCLGLSPIAAGMAVSGDIIPATLVLGIAVLLWVAGFDLIYATQDLEFDRKEGVHSLVVSLGIPKTLLLARLFHTGTWVAFAVFGWMLDARVFYWVGLGVIAGFLVYEHRLVSPQNLSRVNAAFFNMNGLIAIFFLALVVMEKFFGTF